MTGRRRSGCNPLHRPSRHGVLRFLRLPELPCGGRPAEDALRALYRTAFLKHFHFFLLEPSCHRIIEAEERFTVDRDLCQIF